MKTSLGFSHCPLARRPGGFALITTLIVTSLLVLLTMALVGLAMSNTRVDRAGMANNVARNNAQFALSMALGELQRNAGIDQRVTATANIASDKEGNALAAGALPVNGKSVKGIDKGLTSVKPGSRYWTGVWANNDKPAEIYTQTPSPKLVNWLVSGNEVLTTALPNYTPASTQVSLSAKGAVSDPAKAALLVGAGSVGTASGSLDGYVSAPLVEIQTPTAAATRKTTGKYAWWVGDEGVKAKVNLAAPYDANTVPTYPTLATQRAGWEVVDGFLNEYPGPGATSRTSVPKLVTLQETALLFKDPSNGATQVQKVFHSATADSKGVLADTQNGGLKLDLSAYLAKATLPAADATMPYAPSAGGKIIPTIAGTDFSPVKGPKWDRMKEFYDLGKVARTTGKIKIKAADNETMTAIAPIVTDLRLLLGAKLVPVQGNPNVYYIFPCAKIAVAIANPYPVDLDLGSGVDLEITVPDGPTLPAQNNVADAEGEIVYPSGDLPSRIWGTLGTKPAYLAKLGSGETAVFKNAVFRISGFTLPKGEARAFTIGAPVLRPSTGPAVTVSLGAFATSAPMDFESSLQLTSTAQFSLAGTSLMLDVRETWTTSLARATLRIPGTSGKTGVLRRLSSFELDNAPFFSTQRRIDATNAPTFTKAFPLQLYSFQMSRPGEDYTQWLPSGDMGLRSSTLRTYADFNVQATRIQKTTMSYNPPPYFMEMANSAAYLPFVAPGGDAGTAFTRNLVSSPLPWGRSTNGPKNTILFSPTDQLASLAQLQHADLTADDLCVSIVHQPGNAVGNSYATPFVKRELTTQPRRNMAITGGADKTGFKYADRQFYDISYRLNAALWDGFFFSTIPQGAATAATPANPKLVKINKSDTSVDLQDGAKSAARLMVDGSFNVNATEKNAWKALLAGTKQLKTTGDAATTSNDAMFPRSLEQTSPSKSPPTGADVDSFSGYRRLTDVQIDSLATYLARQVRLRGPFVSLSQFVNRALIAITGTNFTAGPVAPGRSQDLGRSGPLQSAIDYCGLNIKPDASASVFANVDSNTDGLKLQNDGSGNPRSDLSGTRSTAYSTGSETYSFSTTSLDLNPGATAGTLADKEMLTDSNYKVEQGFRSTGIPGWLTQADVLQVIGPSLSARSDTFRIRAYGESLNGTNNQVAARAWCEAIVQRMPDYVDGNSVTGDLATVRDRKLRDPAAKSDLKSVLNQKFGRRFQIISFRWLSPNEI